MKIRVERCDFTSSSTIGKMYVNDEFQCFTLEDTVREVEDQPVESWKIQNETAIPKGTYKVIIDFSQRFNKEMIHILDVPGFKGVRIHKGNKPEDTEGCILVGQTRLPNAVGGSGIAFDIFYPKLQAALAANEKVSIEIK